MAKYEYDFLVIGGGGAGLVSSKLAHGLGKRVLLVEKDKLGGECTWTGCVPSKAIIKSGYAAFIARHLERFGVGTIPKDIQFDSSKVMDHVRSVVQQIYATHTPEVIRALGIDVQFGSPQFLDNHHITLNQKIISFNKAIITTGTHAFIPPIEGLESIAYLTNKTLFALEKLPESLIIIGGGPIGCEMASSLNRLGVKVTLLESHDRLLVHEDPELVERIQKILREEGVIIHTKWRANKVSQINNTITFDCTDADGKPHTIAAQSVLIATGRRPNVEGLSLDKAGVQFDKKSIIVDKHLRTTAKNIWAAGDVVGPYLFSHVAFFQASLATQNAFIPIWKKKISYQNVMWVTFTDPELANCGMTEPEARVQYGDSIHVYRREYTFDRAVIDRETHGLCKIICHKNGYILGAQILGARAGDIIHEMQVAKVFGKKFTQLYSVMHAYPTYSEVIWHTAKDAYIDGLKMNPFLRFVRFLDTFFRGKNTRG